MKIWAELPQEPLGQRCNCKSLGTGVTNTNTNYCFLSLQAREEAGLPLPARNLRLNVPLPARNLPLSMRWKE